MKTTFNIANLFLIIFATIFTLIASFKHQGNLFYYLIFSLIINLLLIYSLNIKRLFFETYFAAFIWLGFWFKYTFSLIFFDGIVYDSGPPSNLKNIDKALIASIVAITAVFLSYIIRQKFIEIKKYKEKTKSLFEKIYLENKKIVILLFIIVFSSIAILNFNLNIYQKGFVYEHNMPFIFVNFIKWMLLFGLTTFSTFFIYTEILRNKKIPTLISIIIFLEIFMSYTSMLSRAAIFNLSSIAYSFTKYLNIIRGKLKFFSGIIFLILVMFLVNNYSSNYYRINYAIEIEKYVINQSKLNNENIEKNKIQSKVLNDLETKPEPKTKLESNNENDENNVVQFKVSHDPTVKPDPINMSSFVIINRWSGIDSMIAVVSSKKIGFDLFFESLKERKILDNKPFYETTFNIDFDGGKTIFFGEKRVLKGNTLPGIISFLFYTGNYYFLFVIIFFLTLIFSCLEILTTKISNNNMIYASFISYMVAFRLSNFGYAPSDSYLFIISIMGSMVLMLILSNYKLLSFSLK